MQPQVNKYGRRLFIKVEKGGAETFTKEIAATNLYDIFYCSISPVSGCKP